jgi:L-fuculose-phosphate aldolase
MESHLNGSVSPASLLNATIRTVLNDYLGKSPAQAVALPCGSVAELFHSPQVNQLKFQIVDAGKRLWQREYVDGNGGNISARINDHLVLCTPTLCSKNDLREEELSIVDLENRQMYGTRPQTSEILMHLEIYKAVPQAMAAIHCHPPYATAHAVAGVIPQGNLIPEQEVFVGPVALAPYQTPGTKEFAQAILPFVRQHNTILLANHGIVCWADSVPHAGWYVEVVENYCKTLMIATQLRHPLPEIPADKILDLLAIKKRMGLPDARFPLPAAEPAPEPTPYVAPAASQKAQAAFPFDEEKLAAALTARILQVMEELA